MSARNAVPNCFEVLGGVDEAITRLLPEGMNYFVLGGVAGSAYEDPATVIIDELREVIARGSADKSVIRDSGSCRGIDILVDGFLPKELGAEISHAVGLAVEGHLISSVFGIDRHEPDLDRRQRIAKNLNVFVSQRSVDDTGRRFFSMHPIEQEVQKESYAPWKFVTPQGYEISILHPVAHVTAYDLRSIGGPRPKDSEKLAKSRFVIDVNFDVGKLTGQGGQFYEWKLFGDAMQMLRDGKMPLHHSCMKEGTGKIDQLAFRVKASALGTLEANQRVVDFALNGPVQKALNVFTGAK